VDSSSQLPTLVIVSGPAGSGKTTLAHQLAAAIGCPALCRDEIKEGMVATTPGFVPGPSDPLTVRSYGLFFAAIRLFLEHGVTHVAEAAFQHANWERGLEPLLPLAMLRIVRCQVNPRSRKPGPNIADTSCTLELHTTTPDTSAWNGHSSQSGSTHPLSTSTRPLATALISMRF
jgi:DNA polymerase III delta prime subunit